jgi:phage-related holin
MDLMSGFEFFKFGGIQMSDKFSLQILILLYVQIIDKLMTLIKNRKIRVISSKYFWGAYSNL